MNNQYPLSYGGQNLSLLNGPCVAQQTPQDAQNWKHARSVEYHAFWQLIKRVAGRKGYQSLSLQAKQAMLEDGVSQLKKKRQMEGKAVGLLNTDEMIQRHLHKPPNGTPRGPLTAPLGPPRGDYRGNTNATYGGGDFNAGYAPHADFPYFDLHNIDNDPVTENIDHMNIKIEAGDFVGLDNWNHSIGDPNLGGPVRGYTLPRLGPAPTLDSVAHIGQANSRQPPSSPGISIEEYETPQPEDEQEKKEQQQQGSFNGLARLQQVERDNANLMQVVIQLQSRLDRLEGQERGRIEDGAQSRLEDSGQKQPSSGDTGQKWRHAIDLG